MPRLSEQASFTVPAALPVDRARAVLRDGQIDIVGRMPWSSNATFLAEARDGDDSTLAIYKPRQGERPLWDFAQGTLCEREVAAAVLSEILGWELVPDTVLRDGPFGIGSVQQFHDHDPEQHYFELLTGREELFRRFAVFDVLANNTDRKAGHIIHGIDDHIWGIDHGVCFHEQWKLRTVIWEFAGEAIPDRLLEDVSCAMERILGGESGLDSLLSPHEIDALLGRAQRTLRSPRFPLTTGDYHDYPWPLV
jgi:hypothetical protein